MQHFPSVIPVSSLCHSRENGNPVFLSGSRIKCGMTKRNVDPQSEALRFRLRMTRGGMIFCVSGIIKMYLYCLMFKFFCQMA